MCSGGRGSPWRTPTSNGAPRLGERTRPTAPPRVPHLTPRPPPCAGPLALAPSRGPCAPLLRRRAASAPGGGRGLGPSLAPDGLGCGGEDNLCGPPTGRRSFCLLQRSASPEGGRLRGGEVGDVMRASTQRLPCWEGFSSCSAPRSPARAPRESLLPLCWPLGPMRHLNSLTQA